MVDCLIVCAVVYMVIINLIAFCMYYVDKRRAVRHEWRIPEKHLIVCGALGGTVGSLLAMKIFRHKTKHVRFMVGVPLMLTAQAIILALVLSALL